jgi:TPR repeat protein
MQRAAELDHAPAQYDLSAFYKEGKGVPKDEAKSTYWVCKAADGGLTNAELECGIAYYLGKGQHKSEAIGFRLIRSAAEKGNPVAQNRLAHAYAGGKGTAVNPVEAMKWHLLARQAGVSDFALDRFLASLAPDDRAKAEQAASMWEQSTAALLQ